MRNRRYIFWLENLSVLEIVVAERVGTSKIVESLNDLNIDLLRLKRTMLKEENDTLTLKRSSKALR